MATAPDQTPPVVFAVPRDHLERHLWMESHVAALYAGADAKTAAQMADDSRAEFAARFYPEEE